MKLKRFKGPTMPEVMQKIRVELGKDAVILQSKEVKKGGILGFFQKKHIEVVAALDPQPTKPAKQVPDIRIEKNANVQHREIFEQHTVVEELQYMRKIMEAQAGQSTHTFSPEYEIVYQYLLEQEICPSIAKDLLQTVVDAHHVERRFVRGKEIVTDVKEELEKRLQSVSFEGLTYDSQIVHFIGPTGVGKTTTLAKIAANALLKDKKTVAFITTDTYRIAAIEQLKTYARILEVPVKVAYSTEDYMEAVGSFSTYDLILVDTAGRNYRDETYVQELSKQIHATKNVSTFLVLSLTAKAKDSIDIYEQFNHIGKKKVIFTKLDETRQYGSIVNIALEKKVDIAYITNGQDVPNDVIHPTSTKIANYIMSEYDDT